LTHQLRNFSKNWAYLAMTTGRPFLNFGDELSPLVWEVATGRPATWASPETAEVSAVGSILEFFRDVEVTPLIWGSGVHGVDVSAETLNLDSASVVAVRGPRTAAALDVAGPVSFGDPGLLASQLVPRVPSTKRSGVAFIPHFHTWGSRVGRDSLAHARRAGVHVLRPTLAPKNVIRRVARSELVLSSSLHGVIVAHSLGVPALLVRIPGGGESDFKYRDYFESIEEDLSFASLDAFLNQRSSMARDAAIAAAPRIERKAEVLASGLVDAISRRY
jgi:pyruvyltransferase